MKVKDIVNFNWKGQEVGQVEIMKIDYIYNEYVCRVDPDGTHVFKSENIPLYHCRELLTFSVILAWEEELRP